MDNVVEVTGRKYVSEVITRLGEDGIWTAQVYIRESRTTDGENWEEREVSAQAMDNQPDAAYNTAMIAVMEKFNEAIESGNGASMFKD